jgi:K+-sensing histidine kinase KdpD
MDVTIPTRRKRIAAMTKTPEDWLSEVSPEKARGIFKLFLGYAPGVGKTYNMLSEAIRRASRGEDVVAGVVESHGRKATAELAAKLDRISPRKLEYKGTKFEEMDVDAILARKPAVTNWPIPTSREASTPSGTKMSWNCWRPKSMCSRP